MTTTRTATGQLEVHAPEAVVAQLQRQSQLMAAALLDSDLAEPTKKLYLDRYAEQFGTLMRLTAAGHDMSSAVTMMDAVVLYALGLRSEPKIVQQVFLLGLAFFNPEYRNELAT